MEDAVQPPEEEPVDFVLVWDGSKSEAVSNKSYEKRRVFEKNLEEEGLILDRDVIKSKQLFFVKIRATVEVLKRYGEILKLRMPIKEIPGVTDGDFSRQPSLIKQASDYLMHGIGSCFKLDPELFPKKKRKVTTFFSRDKEYLFDIDEDNISEFFTPTRRSRIVQFILRRKRYKDSKDEDNASNELAFGYERLVKSGVYSAAYPLHDGSSKSVSCQRGLLLKEWGLFRNCLKFQPLNAIKEYFGVKVGLYFAWLGFYVYMLIPASILGLACSIYGWYTLHIDEYTKSICESTEKMCPLCDHYCDYWELKARCFHSKLAYLFDNDSTAVFAFIMSLWTVIFLEYWKRYSSEITHKWELTGFDEKDQTPRPEYLARLNAVETKKFNIVTNSMEPAVPFWRMRLPYTLFSVSTMLILMCVALAALFGVIMYRLATLVALSTRANSKPQIHAYELVLVNVTAACFNLMFIMIFNRIYKKIAACLTEMEIPRTQYDFDASYTFKIYVLQFINYYSALFYIAYFKGNFIGAPHKYIKLFGKWRQEECGVSCMPELCIQLAVIMIGKQARNTILDLVVPAFKKLLKKIKLRSGVGQEKVEVLQQQMVKDYELLDWTPETLTEEYLEMVIQYGFVTIFVAAFPLAPLFAFLNNILEIRVDAQKLLKHYKRPVGVRVKGIGVWYSIMNSVAKFAVLSNVIGAFIIAITSSFIPKLMYRYGYHNINDPKYGTLDGFLQHSLCQFDTNDIDKAPTGQYLRNKVDTCSYATYRYGHNETLPDRKYDFTDFHWKVWLARVVFVIVFENLVTCCVLFLSWLIPDVPTEVEENIQREEYLTNELIIKQELLRARGVVSNEGGCFRKIGSLQEGVDLVVNIESEGEITSESESKSHSHASPSHRSNAGKKKKHLIENP